MLTPLLIDGRGQHHFYLSLTRVMSYHVFVDKAVNAGQYIVPCTLNRTTLVGITQSIRFYPVIDSRLSVGR